MHINNKKIWMIGASTGIGEKTAELLNAKGATLILSARDEESLMKVRSQCSHPEKTTVVPVDVTDQSSIEKAWQAICNQNLIPDVIVYNPGVYEPMGYENLSIKTLPSIFKMIDVNLNGALRILAQTLPDLQKNKQKTANKTYFVLVASSAGYTGLPNAAGYGISKAALQHLAENLRADLDPNQFTIQIINPGFVKTRLTDKNDFDMPSIMEPEEAAQAIVKGLEKDKKEIAFPFSLIAMLKLIRALPSCLSDRIKRRIKDR